MPRRGLQHSEVKGRVMLRRGLHHSEYHTLACRTVKYTQQQTHNRSSRTEGQAHWVGETSALGEHGWVSRTSALGGCHGWVSRTSEFLLMPRVIWVSDLGWRGEAILAEHSPTIQKCWSVPPRPSKSDTQGTGCSQCRLMKPCKFRLDSCNRQQMSQRGAWRGGKQMRQQGAQWGGQADEPAGCTVGWASR